MTGPKPKETILGIHPYQAGKAKVPGFDKPLKLSANENVLGCPEAARVAYRNAEATLHMYPDPRASELRAALAAKHKLDPDRILFGTGSDEIFSMACQAYLSPGDNMVQPQYAFAAWAIAGRAMGAEVKSAPERNYAVDVDAMLAAVDARTRIVFLANPANPTGTYIPFSEVKRFHAALREDVLLVYDGAYAEFGPDGAADLETFADTPNVLVTRTFSKLYGLAALRIGWAYGPAQIIDPLQRIRLPFNLPAPAQAAAVAALADDDFVVRSRKLAAEGRAFLTNLIQSLGWAAIPSQANFVTARIRAKGQLSAAAVEQGLAKHGILVRGLANYGMADCLRITVAEPPEMRRLADALASVERELG
ncbi:MAG: histidinol-phosphate transaminase [Hyphomonadaceae bacterium]|nr:histidinol-phosphate transaminase [Hyphomonadaceae bacterium]